MIRHLLLLLVLLGGVGCGLPRDGEATTDSVRGQTLRVGILSEDPVAAAAVQRLAARLGARVEEVRAPGHALLAGLEAFELDLVYGRIEEDSSLLEKVGHSQPYREETFRVAGAQRAPSGSDLRNDGVKALDPSAALHAAHLGLKLRDRSPWLFLLPGAEPPEGYQARPVGKPIRLVLAVPPGENRWLRTVDEALTQDGGTL